MPRTFTRALPLLGPLFVTLGDFAAPRAARKRAVATDELSPASAAAKAVLKSASA